MSTAPAPKAPPTKPKKDRERERREKEKQHLPGSERLKTVIRRLPPNLPEAIFWQSVEAWVTDQTVTWKTYYPGKFRKRLNKENIPSRAYIAFKTEEQLALFGKEYDGHLFRDKAGNESYAIVEFAPYQKVPSEKKKADARNATIEKDEDYISFLNALNSPATEPASLETLVAAIQPPAPPKTTPLLEALKAEKSAHKDKESNLRNHPHYKEQPVAVISAPRKDDPKKKIAPVPAPKVAPTPADTNNIVAPGAGSHKKSYKKGHALNANVAIATPPHMMAQKAPSQVQASAKNVSAPPAPPAPPPKSPKIFKAPRLPSQPKPAPVAKVVPASNPEAPVATLPAPGGQVAPGPTPRRSRPVVGLASRQFEAALNGAGVGAPGERKSRREREKEREKEAGDTPSSVFSSGAPVATDIKPVHVSPRRDRGGRKESLPPPASGAGAVGGAGLAPGGGPLDSTKLPGILQRSDEYAAPDTVVPVVQGDGGLTQDAGTPLVYGGRGGRRGRGRGRGARGG